MVSLASKCQSISNDSIIRLIPSYKIDNRLTYINFNYANLLKVIQSFDPKKAHGIDGVSVSMLKPRCLSIIKTLFIVIYDWLKIATSPNS